MGGYVVWDQSYLTQFFNWVKSAIGNTTNLAILAFAVLTGIYLVVKVVRLFVK